METHNVMNNDLFVDPKGISVRTGKVPPSASGGFSVVQILPERNQLYGLYSEDFPSILQDRVTDEEWKGIVRSINKLWTPIVDENKRLFSGNLLAYTILAIPVHLAKEHKFRHHENNAMKEITTYLEKINKKYNDKSIAIVFRKEEAHDNVPKAFFIEIRRE